MDNILTDRVTHATPAGKSCVVTDVDLPANNMRAEERKVANGTINAFQLMMERSRACERHDVKPRSLFQRVSKAVLKH
jgi:hypothetical protein